MLHSADARIKALKGLREGMSTLEKRLDAWPDERPELTPFLPFVFCAWADGALSAAELSTFRAHVDRKSWLAADARNSLLAWLDPDHPLTPDQLSALGARIRSLPLDDPEAARISLTDLGLALWRADEAATGPWSMDDAIESLRSVESALGLIGREAVRRALGASAPKSTRQSSVERFDAEALNTYLDRDRRDVRDEVLALLGQPPLLIPLGLDKDEYRERVLNAVRFLAERGLGSSAFPTAYGGRNDRGASLAIFETLAFGDLSVLVKFGVQFGLFGGSVLQLGTERHHRAYLGAIGRLDLPGCYAMTETGHGSNVRDLETTATYDNNSDEIVVSTPTDTAAKDWIGNAACHGQLATVFARLIVGGVDQGVHALLVPIRDRDGNVLAGVRIEDRGFKEGLNGVDNGRIWFEDVRVPRANLLDRFASIDEAGTYTSPIPSSARRFFTMLRTLVAGRVSIASASVSAAKVGLAIAVRYTDQRRQFGTDGAEEQPLLDYLVLQRSLLPRLAGTIATHFAVRALQREYAASPGHDNAELEVMAAALKAYASEQCVETLQACREACGGQGYLAANRFAALKADTDVFTTFEGANLVLYQLVAKGLLSRFKHEMSDLNLWGAVIYLAERAETSLTELNPVATRRTDEEHLLDPAFHYAALEYREERLLRSVAHRLRSRLSDGVDSFQALNECQDHVVTLARAHSELILLHSMQDGVADAPTPGLSEALGSVSALYALSRIEAHSGWYLETGYLEPVKSRAIRHQVNELCRDVRPHARLFVDALGVPEALLPDLVHSI
jgi:acyl-CoA oxidase